MSVTKQRSGKFQSPFLRYKNCETECRNIFQKHELAKEAKGISADNIGSFYKFVNNRLTCSTGSATLIDNAGNAVTSDTDKAELLNQYFGSVCQSVINVTVKTASKSSVC